MYLELVRDRENTAAGGILGRLYVDGVFYGNTLENAAAAIPEGEFNLYTRFSPKFLKNKLAVEVPNRSYIMFHGANYPEQLQGCIGVARERSEGGNIYGDVSDALYYTCKDEAEAGRAVLKVRRETNYLFVVAIAAAALIFLTR